MTVVTATIIDSTHLELSHPIEMPQGGRVIVSVEAEGRLDADWEEWSAVSTRGVAAAYDDDEPDYPLLIVSEPNPEYRP